MSTRCGSLLLVVGVCLFFGSGCALQKLKDSNQRLRESNDRLITENNRLELELNQLQREVSEFRLTRATEPASETVSKLATASGNLGDDLLMDDDIDPAVSVSRTNEGVRFTLKDRVFFAPGQARLSSQGRRILGKVAQRIQRDYRGRTIRVEGHTDDTPTRKVKHLYPSNWELSTARACSVVRYLVEAGDVRPSDIFPAGFSWYRPLAQGRTARARSQNRRVEITVLDRI